MSEQNLNNNVKEWWSQFGFVRIFQGFRMARQPGKLCLALFGIVLIFLAGSILDGLSPNSAKVISDATPGGMNELEAYVAGKVSKGGNGPEEYHARIQRANDRELEMLLMAEPLNMDNEQASKTIRQGEALKHIGQQYEDQLDSVIDTLEKRYESRCEDIKTLYRQEVKRDTELDRLKTAYSGLFNAVTGGNIAPGTANILVNQLVVDYPLAPNKETDMKNVQQDRKEILTTVQLARAYRVAERAQGKGIFSTFMSFSMKRFHRMVSGLIWERDLAVVKDAFVDIVRGKCWLVRFHFIYAVFLTVVYLSIWALVGGAICRMAALELARDERIGPWRALQFSMSKFRSFFAAPLLPLGIIVLIALVMLGVSLLGAVPGIGEILAGLLLGLALFGGFVIALITVGLTAGTSLMYPAIAVEGSDSFDAMSRAFSYIFLRPWRTGFYTAVAAIYGAICYLFVRLFAFLLLLSVHSVVRLAINLDGSSKIGIRGKLDAIWAAPTFSELQPSINWMSLGATESLGAFFIWIWVALVVGLLIAFLANFYFSATTAIYYLLRHKVDETDMEDVYVDQDVEELMGDQGLDQAEPVQPKPETAKSDEEVTEEDSPSDTDEQENPPEN